MLLIFDFDGTLADTWTWLAEELVLGAPRLGYRQMTRDQLEELRGLETPFVFESLGIGETLLPIVAEDLLARAKIKGEFQLFEGISELVIALHNHGHTLAVVSSNLEAVVRATLSDLATLFRFYRCGTAVFSKTDAFKALMEEAACPKSLTLAVGDETRDIEAAQSAMIDVIAVEWGFAKPALLRSISYGRCASTIAQLGEMIETITEERLHSSSSCF